MTCPCGATCVKPFSHRNGMRERRELSPGQVFVVEYPFDISDLRHVLVVVDNLRERDIWAGAVFAFGDVMPNMSVEVLL